MTPYQLGLAIEEYNKRREAQQKEIIYQAYLISRWVWAKRIDIKSIIGEESKTKRAMTDDEMEKQARILNRLFGGEEVSG